VRAGFFGNSQRGPTVFSKRAQGAPISRFASSRKRRPGDARLKKRRFGKKWRVSPHAGERVGPRRTTRGAGRVTGQPARAKKEVP